MIKPYKQQFTHSCLVAGLFMLKGGSCSKEVEGEILIKGMDRKYPFYVVGIPKEFCNKFKVKLNVVVDNKFFTNKLIEYYNDNTNIYHKKITINLIRKLLEKGPLICHIDDNYFGDYSHASHFIVLEKATDKKIVFLDPMTGKRSFIKDEVLEKLIESLKKHIKMCPLLFYI